MNLIKEETTVNKHIRNGWTGKTVTTINGQQFEITTLKTSGGKITSNAQAVEASRQDEFRVTSFSFSDMMNKRTELISRKGRATEKAVRQQHAEAVIKFDEKAKAGDINGLEADKPAAPEVGTIIFMDGYGKTKGSYGNKGIVYEVESTKWGTNYKTVDLDTLALNVATRPRPYAEKFGIGNYFEPGYKFDGDQNALSDMVIQAKQQEQAENEAKRKAEQEAQAEQRRKINEGRELINIPEDTKAVIVADLYENTSDSMTDHFSTKISKRVILAFSRSTRNNMNQLKKAAKNFAETAELTGEQRSGGGTYLPDYFLGSDRWHGWKVRKVEINRHYITKADIFIAAAEGRYKVPQEEETKPEPAAVEVEPGAVEYVDYSAKAFAIIGDTKPIKETLKSLGGKFNYRLKCGAGWIFSKARSEDEVRAALNL